MLVLKEKTNIIIMLRIEYPFASKQFVSSSQWLQTYIISIVFRLDAAKIVLTLKSIILKSKAKKRKKSEPICIVICCLSPCEYVCVCVRMWCTINILAYVRFYCVRIDISHSYSRKHFHSFRFVQLFLYTWMSWYLWSLFIVTACHRVNPISCWKPSAMITGG